MTLALTSAGPYANNLHLAPGRGKTLSASQENGHFKFACGNQWKLQYLNTLKRLELASSNFYRAMLCMRDTIAMGLCLSVCHKSEFY